MTTTDPFNTADVRWEESSHHLADYCEHAGVGKACRRCRRKFDAAAQWARDYLTAAQEPADAAQIIDEHRIASRWTGDGVVVECACGHESAARYDFTGPITAEQNNHRDADRKHTRHVADMLTAARADRRDEEKQ